MEVIGYKAFKGGLTNKYGAKFEVGSVYEKDPNTLRFGEGGHGYHLASKLADTFRFFDPALDNVYCKVMGFGKIVQEDNYLYDAAPMYVVEKFKITKVLTREDIFQYVCQADVDEFRRFLMLFPFTKEELNLLRDLVVNKEKEYQLLLDATKCQQGDIKTFKRSRKYLRDLSIFG